MFKVIAVAVAIAATTTVAGAQGTALKSSAKPATQASTTAKTHHRAAKASSQAALQKEAKISEETARATALKEVPNGTVKSEKLEKEHGKVIYSYDISVPGKSGVQEVNVNAVDGTVVAKEHESAKTEKKEAAAAKKAPAKK